MITPFLHEGSDNRKPIPSRGGTAFGNLSKSEAAMIADFVAQAFILELDSALHEQGLSYADIVENREEILEQLKGEQLEALK